MDEKKSKRAVYNQVSNRIGNNYAMRHHTVITKGLLNPTATAKVSLAVIILGFQ